MPALLGPIVGFALGALLAWLHRGEAPREDEAAAQARTRIAALFAGLVHAPVCAYFVAFAGDWALFYLDEARAVPSALWLLLVVLDAALVVAGFRAGYEAARRRADRALLALWVVPAAGAAAIAVSLLGRLRVDGTFHQVSARFGTRPVAGGPLGYAILWMGAMMIGGMVIAARALGGRVRAAPRSQWGIAEPHALPAPPPGAPLVHRSHPPAGDAQTPGPAGERPPLLGRKRRG